jgi:polar amino acid transport system permease protein
VLGFLLALARLSSDPLARLSARIYATIFRGVPELLTLFVVYYGSQYLVSLAAASLFGTTFEVSPFLAGMVALGLVEASYAGEIFLAAFRDIPAGQYEAGRALGMQRWPILRLIIAPQLIRLALPALSNLWLNLMKDTALVSVITLNDLLRQTQVAVSSTRQPFFFYMVACFIYLALSLLSSLAIGRTRRWASRGVVQR